MALNLIITEQAEEQLDRLVDNMLTALYGGCFAGHGENLLYEGDAKTGDEVTRQNRLKERRRWENDFW